jgi:hypothetical protein
MYLCSVIDWLVFFLSSGPKIDQRTFFSASNKKSDRWSGREREKKKVEFSEYTILNCSSFFISRSPQTLKTHNYEDKVRIPYQKSSKRQCRVQRIEKLKPVKSCLKRSDKNTMALISLVEHKVCLDYAGCTYMYMYSTFHHCIPANDTRPFFN